jgi:F-type H+-transporting ATPase subunit delta
MRSGGRVQPEAAVNHLRDLDSAVRGSLDLRNVLASPAIAVERKNAVMGRLCDALGMDRLLKNFVFVMVRKRRSGMLTQIREAFERLLDERIGVVKAQVSSAQEISAGSRASLEAQLSRVTGKRVRAHYAVDPALLGGVTARIGSTVYDGSVRGQLEVLRRKLMAGA